VNEQAPRRRAAAGFLLAALVATSPGAPGQDTPGSEIPAETAAAIARSWDAWLTAYETGDAAALASLFTDDGLYAANTGEVLQGRAGIRDGVDGWAARQAMFLEALGFPADSRIDVQDEVLRLRGADDAVYRLSRFLVLVEPRRCALDAGHLLGVWRRGDDGTWRLESLLGNRDRRPPEQACGTRGAPD
jgi:uncharacterized protein (TIGR02246 family)